MKKFKNTNNAVVTEFASFQNYSVAQDAQKSLKGGDDIIIVEIVDI